MVGELLEDWPQGEKDLAELKRRVLSNPLYRNVLISEDARVTTISIRTQAYSSVAAPAEIMAGFDDLEAGGGADFLTGRENSEVVAAVTAALERFREPGLELWMAGGPYLTVIWVQMAIVLHLNKVQNK